MMVVGVDDVAVQGILFMTGGNIDESVAVKPLHR